MKNAIRLALLSLALLLGADSGRAAPRSSTRTASAGGSFVRLTDWARANQFQIRWLSPDRTLQLSNRLARLVFTVDAHQDRSKAVINGVQVSLAFPLSYQNGSVYISQIDLSQTLAPILHPPRNAAGLKVRTICLDPGHGGKDPGYQVGSNSEKKYTLLLAQEIREQLRQAGFNVILTRSTDYFVPLESRPDLARRRKADLFVSLHFNAFPPSSAIRGVETYCLTPAGAFSSNSGGEGNTGWVGGNRQGEKNMHLAYQVHRALVKNLPVEDRGVKRARYKVLANASMPAVLVEGGFLSNPAEGKKIGDSAYRRQMARAIVSGILAYKKAVNG